MVLVTGNRHVQAVPDPADYPPVEVTMRLRSPEYGDGTVVAMLGIGIQVRWDRPILGTLQTHMLVHDPVFIAKLERL